MQNTILYKLLYNVIMFMMLYGCGVDVPVPTDQEKNYQPTYVTLELPEFYPEVDIPEDNLLTEEGIFLGRKLFYDPILSLDSTISCSSCHSQSASFSGGMATSNVNGTPLLRSTMHLVNLVWTENLAWDGRNKGLENKIEGSLTNPFGMAGEDDVIQERIEKDSVYSALFFEAFGSEDANIKRAAKALAQFARTMIAGDSKYDRYLRGEATLTTEEYLGMDIFFSEKGDCFHCHGTVLFTDNLFHNNGLDSVPDDIGQAAITGNNNDKGKFRATTLKNIEHTAPYMHDGRFNTVEEVIDFYSEGVQWSETIDPLMKKVSQGGIHLTQQEKNNLIAYLKTLSDTTFINSKSFMAD